MPTNYLRDFLQGASNSAASTVSAPIDALSWLLRKAGAGGVIGGAPVGGSDWMAQQGLTREPVNRLAGLLGESVGGVAPILAAAKAPQIASGLLAMERNALAPTSALNQQRGAVVFHGSQHKFDKFDASKIGTGEGAQAYGHGLYFAESPETAAFYQQKLTSDGTLGGYKTANEARKRLLEKHAARFKDSDPARSAKLLADAEAITEGGALYKVDLPDEHIAKMLDWDKPFSQQPQVVQEAAKKLGIKPTVARDTTWGGPATREMSGMEIYNEIDKRSASLHSPQSAAALRDAGVFGVKYLDGVSRGAGAGSSNFVVFPGNESLLSILGRQ